MPANRPRSRRLFAIAYALAGFAVMLRLDAMAQPRGSFGDRPVWAHVAALAALASLFAVWFAASWRPYLATGASVVTYAIVVAISNFKNREVAEPLDVMDFILFPQVLRHPMLYSAEFLYRPAFAALVAGTTAFVLAWCAFVEPSVLPRSASAAWAIAGVAAAAGVVWLWCFCPVPQVVSARLSTELLPARPAVWVRRFGLAASLAGGLLAWRGVKRAPPLAQPALPNVPAVRPGGPEPVVIVVQSESFVDLRAAGLLDVELPAIDSARRRAFAWGRLTVPVQGAWTLRSEISFLSGMPAADLGFDALHPYARLDALPRCLPRSFADAGFRTAFIHPFDLRFFRRHAAMPALGFGTLVGEGDFGAADREGWFVSDEAAARRALEMVREGGPLFAMLATMENHNPWRLGRLPGIESHVDQYVHHLRNADRMVAMLVRQLEASGRPAVLVFYGDHVPIMPRLADPFPDTRTDYFVLVLGPGAPMGSARRDRDIHELAGLTLEALAAVSPGPASAP